MENNQANKSLPSKTAKKEIIPSKRSRESIPFHDYCLSSLQPIDQSFDSSPIEESGEQSSSFNLIDDASGTSEQDNQPKKRARYSEDVQKTRRFTSNELQLIKSHPPLELQATEEDKSSEKYETQIQVHYTKLWKDGKPNEKGCNCKKSGCLKKYCDCFKAFTMCNELCKCTGCLNTQDTFPYKFA